MLLHFEKLSHAVDFGPTFILQRLLLLTQSHLFLMGGLVAQFLISQIHLIFSYVVNISSIPARAYKSVHFEFRMVLHILHDMRENSTLVDFFSIECRKYFLLVIEKSSFNIVDGKDRQCVRFCTGNCIKKVWSFSAMGWLGNAIKKKEKRVYSETTQIFFFLF